MRNFEISSENLKAMGSRNGILSSFLLKRVLMSFIIFFISIPITQLTLSMIFTLVVRDMQSIKDLIPVKPLQHKIRSLSLIDGNLCVLIINFIIGVHRRNDLGITIVIVCI